MSETTIDQGDVAAQDGVNRGGAPVEVPEDEVLQVLFYPEDADSEPADELQVEIEALVAGARSQMQPAPADEEAPAGRVSNASNAVSGSDSFNFWAPAEENTLGIGSLVHHCAPDPIDGRAVDTYGIITSSEAKTLGLDDYAIDVYEQNGRPPLSGIVPTLSRRRPIFSHKARVIASNAARQRPVLSGPVYAVRAAELAALHKREPGDWPGSDHFLLGFYEDAQGEYGVFAEERARVLGPKQGHVILSGMPGAGKTSLFLSSVIALYAQLSRLQEEIEKEGSDDGGGTSPDNGRAGAMGEAAKASETGKEGVNNG